MMRHSLIGFFAVLMLVAPAAHADIEVQEVRAAGITAWLVEDNHVPVVHVTMAFKGAGHAGDPADQSGRAKLFARMMLEGTERQNDEDFQKALEEKAIAISASASRDHLSVSMKTLREHRAEAFALMAQALLEPRLDPAKLEELRARSLAELKRMEEIPEYIAARAWDMLAYGDHPYARASIGTTESIAALRADDMRAFHDTKLAKNNLVMAVVGDMDAHELAEYLETYFADLPEEAALSEQPKAVTISDTGQWDEVARELPQSVMVFGRQGVARKDARFYAAYVMNHILGGSSLTSRLGKEVRQKRGLTYGIGTQLDNGDYADSWYGMFATRADQADEAFQAAEAAMTEMAKTGVTQAELDAAIGFITGSFPLNIDSNGAILDYLIAMQLNDLGKDYLNKRNDYFRSVTLDEVNALAAEWLNPQTFKVVKVGQAGAKEAQ